jgi:hypothetical protein
LAAVKSKNLKSNINRNNQLLKSNPLAAPEPESEPVPEPEPIDLSCTTKTDCAQGEYCIDGTCGTLAEQYESDCASKCNYASAEVTTSDDQDFTINRGQGSYTLAGAIEWKLMSVPDYCKGDDFVVPIKLLMKDKGKVISEVVTMTKLNQASKTVTHPNIPYAEFTLTVKSIEETCG